MINNTYEIPPVLKDFLAYMETIKGKSPNTIQVYFYDLRLFFRYLKQQRDPMAVRHDFDKIPIGDITIDLLKSVTLSDLYSYLSFVSHKRDNIASSRARKVASLKSFFKYLTNKAKLLNENPANELESPKVKKVLPKYLEVHESIQLLSSIKKTGKGYFDYSARDYAIITFFLNCGMRLSELVGINHSSIRDNALTIMGKGGKERIIYLNQACLDAFRKYNDHIIKLKSENHFIAKDKDALFLSERRTRISKNTVQYIVKKYIREAGLDPNRYSAHKLRHTAATLMYKYGNVDIRALQELLGHASISTTEIYTHLDSKQLKDAVNSNPLANFTPD